MLATADERASPSQRLGAHAKAPAGQRSAAKSGEVSGQWRREGVAVDALGQDSTRPDADQLAGEALARRLGVRQGLGVAADLDAAGRPGLDGREIVDDEGDPGVAANVAELLPAPEL